MFAGHRLLGGDVELLSAIMRALLDALKCVGVLVVPFHAPLAHEQHCLVVVDGTVLGQPLDARMILRPRQSYRG